jgi:hypothetical protein
MSVGPSVARPFRPAAAAGRVPAMNVAAKWVGGAIAVPVIAIVLYLGAVFQVYLLAWIVDLIGTIFG